MTRIALIALLFLSLPAEVSLSGAEPVLAYETSTDAMSTLDEAYKLSSTLGELDRLRFWNNLIIETPAIAPDRVAIWADKLIEDVRKSSNPNLLAWDKVAYQKNAIVALSKVDPAAAMDAFSGIGPAQPNAHNHIPEDVRAFGARTIFFNYWRALGPASLPRIRSEAKKLPETQGAYPFHAMSLIIGDLGQRGAIGKKEATAIFSEALLYYQCGSKVENQDDDFLTFLQNTRTVIDKPLFKQGIQELVSHLVDVKCYSEPKEDSFIGVLQTSQGAIRLTDDNKLRLFQAFPLINYVDPELAADLRRKNPELEKADATVEQVIGSYVDAKLPPAEREQLQKIGLQQSLTRAVQLQRRTNPQAALQLADLLEDPNSRFIQVASILPQLAHSDLPLAKRLYTNELNDFDNFPDTGQKLMAAVWVAEGAYETEDAENFKYLANTVFENAAQRFESSYNSDSSSMVEDRPGYKELAELAEFGAAHDDVNWLSDEVRQMTDPRLRTYLLMHIAKGLAGAGSTKAESH